MQLRRLQVQLTQSLGHNMKRIIGALLALLALNANAQIYQAGAQGPAGATGATGATGAAGPTYNPAVSPVIRNVVVVTGNYTVQPNDHEIEVNSVGPATITLPAATANNGRYLVIKRIDAGMVDIKFTDAGGGTVEGQTTFNTAAGKTTHGFRASAAANDWRFEQTYVPALQHTKYASVTIKAGDTLTNPTTETAFASQATFAAGYLGTGQTFRLDIAGTYTVPSGTLNPTALPKIKIGATAIASAPALTVGTGTGINYGYIGYADCVIIAVGATGSVNCGGQITFQTATGLTPQTATVIFTSPLITVDTTIDNTFTASFTTAPSAAGTQVTMTRFALTTAKKGADSN